MKETPQSQDSESNNNIEFYFRDVFYLFCKTLECVCVVVLNVPGAAALCPSSLPMMSVGDNHRKRTGRMSYLHCASLPVSPSL